MPEKKGQESFVSLWDAGQLYISKGAADGLGGKLDAYCRNDVVALRSDPLGRYYAVQDGQGRRISSKELADWVKRRFSLSGGERLPAWFSHDGAESVLYFGPLRDQAAAVPFSEREYEKLDLYYARLGDLYLLDGLGWSFYVSAAAAARLGGSVSLYTSGDCLALCPDPFGELPISGSSPTQRHTVSSERLKTLLLRRFPGISKYWLFPCGDMLVISDRPDPPRRQDLPGIQDFHRVELDHHKNGGLWAALEVDRLRISKAAAVNLGDCVSVYDAGSMILLLNDVEDASALPVYSGQMKMVLSRGLSRLMNEKFNCTATGTLRASVLNDGVALYGHQTGISVIDRAQLIKLNRAVRGAGGRRRHMGQGAAAHR